MSVTSAMYTGVTGLLANADGMNVIGNNLANVNTIGFKSGRILFSDMLSTSVTNSYSASQIGRGTQIQKIDNLFTQSSFDTTEVVTDLAIQGNSFFALKESSAGAPLDQSAALLTKAGAFRLDSNLYLVNADGYQVLDTSGNPIQFSDNVTGIQSAAQTYNTGNTIQATTDAITDDINNNIQAVVNAMVVGSVARINAQALLDAAQAANDNAIAKNAVLQATQTGATAKDAHTAVQAAYTALQAAASAAATVVAAGTTTAATAEDTAYGLVNTQIGKAFSRITKIDPTGLITYLGQDGLSSFYYDASGAVGIATTKANSMTAQRLAIISPADSSALEKVGGSMYKATLKAGVPTAGFSTTSNSPNGTSEKIFSNSLEQSNVDMASQFVKMIMTQRAYSANSKTITASDEMTQEVLNMKR